MCLSADLIKNILGLLSSFRVALLMRGVRKFDWQVFIISFSTALRSRRFILRASTMNNSQIKKFMKGFYFILL